MRSELGLHSERLNMKSKENEEGEELEEHAFFSAQFKGKCRNCGHIGHKLIVSMQKSFEPQHSK
jgi:hypothetical protein